MVGLQFAVMVSLRRFFFAAGRTCSGWMQTGAMGMRRDVAGYNGCSVVQLLDVVWCSEDEVGGSGVQRLVLGCSGMQQGAAVQWGAAG